MAEQAAKALACKLWRASLDVDVRQARLAGQRDKLLRQLRELDRVRPNPGRGPPWCVSVGKRLQFRICFASAWVERGLIDLAARLIDHIHVGRGDVMIVNENMARGEALALSSMRKFAAEVANVSSPLGIARAAGLRILWREKSPQAFSDSPVGAFQHGTYGSPGQHCAVPRQTGRSAAVDVGFSELEASGVGVVRIWDESVSQADQHLASRTAYVARKLDCTHMCEPSGVLEWWADVTLTQAFA